MLKLKRLTERIWEVVNTPVLIEYTGLNQWDVFVLFGDEKWTVEVGAHTKLEAQRKAKAWIDGTLMGSCR